MLQELFFRVLRKTGLGKVAYWISVKVCRGADAGAMTIEQAEQVLRRFKEPEINIRANRKFGKGYDLSIIIPVYNAEKGLKECLESVLQESKYSYEVILVNDGSTDHSEEIIQKYEKNSNVVYLTQMNQGAAAARNKGMDHVRGRYIMFVDADDTLEEGAIDCLMRRAEESQADIIEGGYFEGLMEFM